MQKRLFDGHNRCWLQRVKEIVLETAYGAKIWGELLASSPSLNCECITREAGDNAIGIPWEAKLKEALTVRARSNWLVAVTGSQGRAGIGGNKLRTYATFKALEPYGMEPYLVFVSEPKKRRLLARCRMGIAPFRIERGRYEANGKVGSRGVPPEERICQHCTLGSIEDELHFFMECPKYEDIRSTFLAYVKRKEPSSLFALSNNTRICFRALMSSTCKEVVRAVADYVWNAFVLREEVVLGEVG